MSPAEFQELREQAKDSDKERLTRLEAGMIAMKKRLDRLEKKHHQKDCHDE